LEWNSERTFRINVIYYAVSTLYAKGGKGKKCKADNDCVTGTLIVDGNAGVEALFLMPGVPRSGLRVRPMRFQRISKTPRTTMARTSCTSSLRPLGSIATGFSTWPAHPTGMGRLI
jgi:hypothetical protein